MSVRIYVFLLAVALVLSGCGKSAEQKKIEEAAKQATEAGQVLKEGAEKMSEALKGLGEAGEEGKKVEPVNFRELKALLPESLPGLARSTAEGEKSSVMGVSVSEAHARYENEEGANIEVKITDMGSVSGLVGMATMAWAYGEVDRETENGYEKTTTFSGHKAFEKYDGDSRSGEISILVAKRFIVNVEGNNVEMSAIKDAAGKINMNALEKMKDAGVTS